MLGHGPPNRRHTMTSESAAIVHIYTRRICVPSLTHVLKYAEWNRMDGKVFVLSQTLNSRLLKLDTQ